MGKSITIELHEQPYLNVVVSKMNDEWDENNDEIITLEQFFDDRTMSVHLVENNPPRAKRGEPV